MAPKHFGKERLTITMRKDVLASLDSFIDGDKIRNRSHAIEYIVGRHLGAGLTTCVILASGQVEQGSRPLLRIHNRPVIAYTIELLKQAAIYNIVMVINSQNKDIIKYLEDGSQWGVHITYVEDDEGTGTANALAKAKPYLKNTFLLMYGDIVADLDLQELIRFHKEQDDVLATLAVTACTNPSLFGVTELQGNRVYRIMDKPSGHEKSNLVYAGIAVCEASVLDYVEQKPNHYLVRDVLPDIAHRGQIAGYPFTGKWFDVSHADEYEKAKTEWVSQA